MYKDPSFVNLTGPPVTTSSVEGALGPEMTSTPVYYDVEHGRSKGIISPSISAAAMLLLCAFVAFWLSWRKLSSPGLHTYSSIES
jgi:hypothetical protein